MLIAQFQLLNDDQKEQVVWDSAMFLGNYDEGNTICDAYELFDFYVAFCYYLDRQEKAVITAHIYADQLPLMVTLN
ncbi:MAG: hypothetical protein WKF89_13670 [Chitinophagaceae bacterium]